MTDTVRIPDLSAAEIVSAAIRKFDLRPTPIHATYLDFIRVKAGRTYAALTHRFDRDVTYREVQEFFHQRGAAGDTAAFIVWLTQKTPFGAFASIPDDADLYRIPGTNLPYAPIFERFRRSPRRTRLTTRLAISAWYDHWVFVAFRDVSPLSP